MYLSIIILPLLGSIVSGFFGRKVGVMGAQIIICLSVIIISFCGRKLSNFFDRKVGVKHAQLAKKENKVQKINFSFWSKKSSNFLLFLIKKISYWVPSWIFNLVHIIYKYWPYFKELMSWLIFIISRSGNVMTIVHIKLLLKLSDFLRNFFFQFIDNFLHNILFSLLKDLISSFITNYKKRNLIFAIEKLIIGMFVFIPSLRGILICIFYTFLFNSGIFTNGELFNLNLDVNHMICYTLNTYLIFILTLMVTSLIILFKDKFKNYPLVYECILLILSVVSILSFFYFVGVLLELINYIVDIVVKCIVNNLLTLIKVTPSEFYKICNEVKRRCESKSEGGNGGPNRPSGPAAVNQDHNNDDDGDLGPSGLERGPPASGPTGGPSGSEWDPPVWEPRDQDYNNSLDLPFSHDNIDKSPSVADTYIEGYNSPSQFLDLEPLNNGNLDDCIDPRLLNNGNLDDCIDPRLLNNEYLDDCIDPQFLNNAHPPQSPKSPVLDPGPSQNNYRHTSPILKELHSNHPFIFPTSELDNNNKSKSPAQATKNDYVEENWAKLKEYKYNFSLKNSLWVPCIKNGELSKWRWDLSNTSEKEGTVFKKNTKMGYASFWRNNLDEKKQKACRVKNNERSKNKRANLSEKVAEQNRAARMVKHKNRMRDDPIFKLNWLIKGRKANKKYAAKKKMNKTKTQTSK